MGHTHASLSYAVYCALGLKGKSLFLSLPLRVGVVSLLFWRNPDMFRKLQIRTTLTDSLKKSLAKSTVHKTTATFCCRLWRRQRKTDVLNRRSIWERVASMEEVQDLAEQPVSMHKRNGTSHPSMYFSLAPEFEASLLENWVLLSWVSAFFWRSKRQPLSKEHWSGIGSQYILVMLYNMSKVFSYFYRTKHCI